MSIVDTNKWVPPDTTTFDTVQKLKQNPVHAYRELLMAEDEDGDPEPYYFTSGGAGVYILRIAHGLSRDGHPRIPDVVIPMAGINASKPGLGFIFPIWFGKSPALPPIPPEFTSKTGTWADDEYVYLLSIDTGEPQPISFVVYIEYTHSVIKNEIVTGEYSAYYLT